MQYLNRGYSYILLNILYKAHPNIRVPHAKFHNNPAMGKLGPSKPIPLKMHKPQSWFKGSLAPGRQSALYH